MVDVASAGQRPIGVSWDGHAFTHAQNAIILLRFSDSHAAVHKSTGANRIVGEWLSLVEHLVRDQGVGGSNPLSPTNSFKQLERFQHPPFWVQWVQLAISVPQWACGNRVLLAPP